MRFETAARGPATWSRFKPSADWASRCSVRNKAGYRTVAISRGKDAEQLAVKLGAHRYLDSEAANVAEELQRMGGAETILTTAPSGKGCRRW